ncbi:MAG TPA: hypothetical protein VFY89_03420 [Ktedonobacterales bacterium]
MLRTHSVAWRINPAITGLLAAVMLVSALTFNGANTAHAAPTIPAKSCFSGVYCAYHPQGSSGFPSDGTNTLVTVPIVQFIYGDLDGISFHAFLMDRYAQWIALEAGVVYGEFDYCGGQNFYWFPYGTKDDGETEVANCNLQLNYGGSYRVQAWSWNSQGHSAVLNSSGNTVWQYNWGNYGVPYGWNLTEAEVHANEGEPNLPSWSGYVDLFHSQYLDNNDHWNYWGYTATSNDCPYSAIYYSADAWQAASSC